MRPRSFLVPALCGASYFGCVGDSPSSSGPIDGGVSVGDAAVDSGSGPSVDGGDGHDEGGTDSGPLFEARVLDAVGIGASSARVSVTGADGVTHTFAAGPGGKVSGAVPAVPYDMTVQREG